MARIDADLIRKGARLLNARKERLLDLRGNRIAEIENLDAAEDQFDMIDLSDNEIVKLDNFPYMNLLGTLLMNNNRIMHVNPNLSEFLPRLHTLVLTNNRLRTLAEIDPLASLPNLQVLSLVDNTVTKQADYRMHVVYKLKHLTLLDFMKVKQQERTAAAQKFHSKEADEEAKKISAKAYSPVQAAIVNSERLDEVARLKKALSTGQILSESVIPKRDANIGDAPEETDKLETGLKNEADENKEESAPIQLERTAVAQKFHSKEAEEEAKKISAKAYTITLGVDVHDAITKLVEEIARIEKEMLGTGLDSVSINIPGQIDEYIYKNFQRASLRFMSSWRKRPFNEIHIIPPARLQLPGECALHATVALMECHFKVLYASHPDGPREFTVRLSHLHLGKMVREFYDSKEGKKLKGRDKLATCLLMAKIHGVVSEEDFAAGCPSEAVRYRIEEYNELSDMEMQMIPTWLDEAVMILTSFRVNDEYRRILPHDIYRYRRPEKPADVHDAHCVVLTSAGVEFKEDMETVTEEGEEMPEWERYYEYLNSYDGWGVDGCGYIYHDSLRRSYRIRVVDPEI